MSCSIDGCDGNENMPFRCNQCGRLYCSDHRLPEKHNCFELTNSRNSTSEKPFKADYEPNDDAISNAGQATSPSSRVGSIMLLLLGAVLIGTVVGVGVSISSGGGVPLVAGGEPAANNATATATAPMTQTSSGYQSGFWDGLLDEDEQLNATKLEQLVHQEMNEYRRNHSSEMLTYDSELAGIAEYHSDNMAAKGRIYHTSPSGQTVEDRYEKFGYDCRAPVGDNEYLTGGENVLKTYYEVELTGYQYYGTPEELAAGIVEQFVNSKPHRENLMDDTWRREGIGVNVTEEDDGTAVYVTQNFC